MDPWVLLVLLGSGLIHVGANNTTIVTPSVGVTRFIKATTAESLKEETKTSNPTSSSLQFHQMERGFQITSSQIPEQNLGRGMPALQQPLQKLFLLQVILTRRTEEITLPALWEMDWQGTRLTVIQMREDRDLDQSDGNRMEKRADEFEVLVLVLKHYLRLSWVQKLSMDETPIIAVMVALSSLLVIVFIIIVLYMLRFKKYKQAGSHSNSFRLSNGRTEDVEPQSVPLLARSPSTNRKYPPLPVDKLEEEINRRMADDNKLFREEFNALPACPIQATCEAASKEENKEKNRYVNILPYDHSRVHLTPVEGVPDSDYINASFINGYQEKNKFIAAQGPKEETVNDFWRMIWEQNTATIVMVTNLKERKECKCAQYWPDQGCWTYGNIRVSVEDVTVLVDYTVRKFCIQQVGDMTNRKPQRLITQFHFTSWPDFGVPFTPIGMLKFLKKVKACNPQYAGAIVVHCSAGVGRTGTFVVIDAMLDMMHTERKVDVYGFVSRIRAQRCQMVQTDMQYVFIYQALLEHYLYGDTELEVTSLETHLQKIYNKIPGSSNNGLEEEFKKLTSIKIQNDKMRTGNLPANMKKNRVLQIIPYEFNRVIIPVKRGEENTDYVNASFIDGYRQKDSYIASQGPLLHTIEDFWRMIWEWKSCSIVMLTELEERGQEKCAQYWPSDGLVSYGDITVELKKEEECESYTVRDLLVTNTRENKSRQIRQFHFHGWPEVGIPSDGKGMISIIAAVQKQQQQSGNHPITVHCSAGAGRTGTFCALSTVLERVKAEGILDVFQTVKSLRLQRPHMVQTLEQYEFCYKVVQEYIDAFSDYANFK
ncbi:receptor-type tyrosine-protein phosphatase alpha isoform X1 [Hippopotamus amphibius kiboko]|uniref:receptor-type tyrosine-protein phosphatase alpha isoform X1 n=2 Tax=Whippomorpha TaxID=2653789 RepID=UPI002592776F|nr:receptor-type tyrosine-protein phosphatase alpha isoform X1 [Hippopotamus amphibius kiboko]XP_057556842.1 receptor-type tyrosine-protein phosphatase alpha isoform X1 [Hippopotamus amphibius kiboko]